MDLLNIENPVFATYVVAAAIMVVKIMGQGWITVFWMLKCNAGWASPEDLRKGLINRAPDPAQLGPNEHVERARRMHRNDLENIPAFLVAGLLFVAVNPALGLSQWLLYGFVAARTAHFIAYATGRSHEVRATFYTIGSVIVIYMALHALLAILT